MAAAAIVPLLAPLLTQVVIPEITAIIRAHHNATGNMPTDAQVLAALGSDTQTGITIGEAWLAAHPVTTAAAPAPATPAGP
jgi:hypothetical protein